MNEFITKEQLDKSILTDAQRTTVLSGHCPFCHSNNVDAIGIGVGTTNWYCSMCDTQFII
jgi:transposase-like protein